jgi:hypothetical protein
VICDEGAVALAEALRTNNTLQTIVLTDNDISYAGVEYLARSLENNFSLQHLVLGADIPTVSNLLRRNKRYALHLLQIEEHGNKYHLDVLPFVLSKAWIPLRVRFGWIQKHPDMFK